jgi:hypothetical protein
MKRFSFFSYSCITALFVSFSTTLMAADPPTPGSPAHQTYLNLRSLSGKALLDAATGPTHEIFS